MSHSQYPHVVIQQMEMQLDALRMGMTSLQTTILGQDETIARLENENARLRHEKGQLKNRLTRVDSINRTLLSDAARNASNTRASVSTHSHPQNEPPRGSSPPKRKRMDDQASFNHSNSLQSSSVTNSSGNSGNNRQAQHQSGEYDIRNLPFGRPPPGLGYSTTNQHIGTYDGPTRGDQAGIRQTNPTAERGSQTVAAGIDLDEAASIRASRHDTPANENEVGFNSSSPLQPPRSMSFRTKGAQTSATSEVAEAPEDNTAAPASDEASNDSTSSPDPVVQSDGDIPRQRDDSARTARSLSEPDPEVYNVFSDM